MGKKIDLQVDYFKVLGVKASSSDEEVKKAYKALAKQWHPDKNREEGAEDKFKLISAAYDTLKTADGRSIYRRERENAQNEAERETRRKKREANNFYQPSNSDSANARFKTSFFFKTGEPFSGRSQKAYTSRGSDSWRYGDREESPFSGAYSFSSRQFDSNPFEKKNRKKSKQRKPWSQEWNEPSEEDGFKPFGFEWTSSRPSFSSAFNSFVDDLFDFKSFFDGKDPFESFFKKYENIFQPFSSERKGPGEEFTYYTSFHDDNKNSRKFQGYEDNKTQNGKKRAPNSDFTYHASFNDDGNSSRKFQGQEKETRSHNGTKNDASPGFSFDDNTDEDEKVKFECVCCGKLFSVHEDMLRHEIVCKDVNGKANGSERMKKVPSFAKPTGDWRTTHENLIKNLRNLRRSSQTRIEDDDSEEEEQPAAPEAEYIKCHICGRTFNKPAIERHMVYCQMRYQANCGEPDTTNGFFTRDNYPKTMPGGYTSSGIPPSGRHQQAHQGGESPRMSRSTTPGKYSSRTCFPDLSTRRTMDDPFLFTSTGLHGHRSSSRLSSPSPRMYEFRFAAKGSNDFGFSGDRMEDSRHLTRNQCPNCRSVFAKNARYCMKCGFKRLG